MNMFANNELMVALQNLSRRKQLAFALLMVERIFPFLLRFSAQSDSEISAYIEGRQTAWARLTCISESDISSLRDRCINEAPDTESFPGELVSHALNAALSTVALLDFITDHGVDHILEIAEFGKDSIDLYLQTSEPSLISSANIDEKIAADPLMSRECKRRAEDMNFLSSMPENFAEDVISLLKRRANQQFPLLPLLKEGA